MIRFQENSKLPHLKQAKVFKIVSQKGTKVAAFWPMPLFVWQRFFMRLRRSKKVTVPKKLLPLVVAVILAGCAAAPTQTDKASSPPPKDCLGQCQEEYSSCSFNCQEIHREGSGLDFCLQQCNEQLTECEGQCSRQGETQ